MENTRIESTGIDNTGMENTGTESTGVENTDMDNTGMKNTDEGSESTSGALDNRNEKERKPNHVDHLDVSSLPMTESKVSFEDSEKLNSYGAKHPSKISSIVSNGVHGQLSTGDLLNSIDISKQTVTEKYTSCRWTTTYMCFGSIMLSSMLRQCMSMAIVCMENNSVVWTPNQTTEINGTPNQTTEINASVKQGHDLTTWLINWDNSDHGLVLSSYFYGLPLTPVLGGYLSGKFSGKTVVAVMTAVIIMASFLIPICATYNIYLVVVLRCITGFASGGLTPSMASILSKWAPLQERAQINSVASSGIITGAIFMLALSGFICEIPIQNGWPFIFYIFGGANVIGLLLWLFLVYDHPDEHPRISWKEKILILKNRRDNTTEKMPSPPWLKILTSGPFWGLLCAHAGHNFLFNTIGTFLPIYMNDVLRFDTTSNGLLSSLPYIGRLLGTYVSGYAADRLVVKGVLSITGSRKLFHFLGMVMSAPFLLVVSFLDYTQRDVVVILLIIFYTTLAMNNAGFKVNHLDIAPRYAGVLHGMTITCAFIVSLISPLVTSALTQNGTREEWQLVFGICIAVGLGGAIAFVTLGSAQEQEWAKDPNWNDELHVRRMPIIIDEMRKNSSLNKAWTESDIIRKSDSPDNNTETDGRLEGAESPDVHFGNRDVCYDESNIPKVEFSLFDRDIDGAKNISTGFEKTALEGNDHHLNMNHTTADEAGRSFNLTSSNNTIFTEESTELDVKPDAKEGSKIYKTDSKEDVTLWIKSERRRSSLCIITPEINRAFVDNNYTEILSSPITENGIIVIHL